MSTGADGSLPSEFEPTVAEVLDALSRALDLTGGQRRGHAARTALIAGRLGVELGLTEDQFESLHYAALLKDSGGSADAPRAHPAVGDGQRRERGAQIARQLGFSAEACDAIRHMDERWDGGKEIPILARVLALAQTLEVSVSERGLEDAFDAILDRRFDPEVIRAAGVVRADRSFWERHHRLRVDPALVLPTPALAGKLPVGSLDDVCTAFAEIVDAKSSFTAAHSSRVAEYAVAVGRHMGLGPAKIAEIRRAALLHDIGKLGIPNAILDKPGRLTPEEFEIVKRHPRFTLEILSPIRGFARIAAIASAHHERLDGTGYWRGLRAEDLDVEMRILAVADVFDALSARRPYREALPIESALDRLRRSAGSHLDPACVEAMAEVVGHRA